MGEMTMQRGMIPTWTLGDRLRKALDHAELGVQEMAEYLGVSRNTVSNYLHGRVRPDRRTLMLWALRTGVDLVWITSDGADIAGVGDQSTGWGHRQRALLISLPDRMTAHLRRAREVEQAHWLELHAAPTFPAPRAGQEDLQRHPTNAEGVSYLAPARSA